MRIIGDGDERAVKILEKKIRSERAYRLSAYVYAYAERPYFLLRNMITGMIAKLDEGEWDRIRAEESIGGAQLEEAGLADLARYGFLIGENEDDFDQYKGVSFVLKTMAGRTAAGTKTYTILPTTGCNARCVYCFEEGMRTRVMTAETADRVVDFIARTRREGRVKLIWFGGEPLLGQAVISRICAGLREREIPYYSRLITNGTLMTPELLETAADDWHVEQVQVSVDGERGDYEARKNYYNPEKYNYDAMMRAVGLLLSRGIKVAIRCNFDGGNIAGMRTFFDDLKARVGTPENLRVYLAVLFQNRNDSGCVELYRKKRAMNDYLREIGLAGRKGSGKAAKFKANYCMADSSGESVVIDPDGLLFHCEHLPGNEAYGSIFDENIKLRSDPRADLPVQEKCRTCCFLPKCTPFYRNGCPDYSEYCRECNAIEEDETLSLWMRGEMKDAGN